MSLNKALTRILPQVNKPGRYLGCEVNAIFKQPDAVDLRVALAFPDVYEVAFSHLGLMILYNILNRRADIWAERVYAPWSDMEERLREAQTPLFTLESKTPLSEYDLIGFTLQHELAASNILTMLDLGGVPLHAETRGENDPLVIAGGPGAGNPEPLAAFFDAFVFGDGEEVILELSDALIAAKAAGESRAARLARLDAIEGVYVPSFFIADPQQPGRYRHKDDPERRVRRRVLSDLNATPFVEKPLVPCVEPVHDRYALEIQRGCTRGCRFCQAGMLYRPVRQRAPETLLDLARKGLFASGQETLGMLSLSASDYACLGGTTEALFAEHGSRHVSIQLPSLRVEGLDESLVRLLNQERKTGFTLAPEAATDRLRAVINKGNTREDLLAACDYIFANGWTHVKLYFMIGLPTETDEDVAAIVDLARDVRLVGRRHNKAISVTVSVSTFVPKPHTPFQWCSFIPMSEIERKQRFLREELRRVKVAFKWHDKVVSVLEAALARGDRRLSDVIESAWRAGARFDSWTDQFELERWRIAFEAHGLDLEEMASREVTLEDTLCWDHLDPGVSREFLRAEYDAAMAASLRADCAYDRCTDCGVCDHKRVARKVYAFEGDARAEKRHVQAVKRPAARVTGSRGVPNAPRVVRFQFEKTDWAVFMGHLDIMGQVARAFSRAGIALKYSEGFHPKPKIAFSPALPLGVCSRVEFFDAHIMDGRPAANLIDMLNRALPGGIRVLDARQIAAQTPSLSKSLQSFGYRFDFSDLADKPPIEEALKRFDEAETLPIVREGKKKTRTIDLKERVSGVRKKSETVVECELEVSEGGSVKPMEVLKGLFGIEEDNYFRVSIEKQGVRFRTPADILEKNDLENRRNPKKGKRHVPKTGDQRHAPGIARGPDGERFDR